MKGNLDPRANSFIGISRDDRKDYTGTMAKIRAQAQDEYIESPVNAELQEDEP